MLAFTSDHCTNTTEYCTGMFFQADPVEAMVHSGCCTFGLCPAYLLFYTIGVIQLNPEAFPFISHHLLHLFDQPGCARTEKGSTAP